MLNALSQTKTLLCMVMFNLFRGINQGVYNFINKIVGVASMCGA